MAEFALWRRLDTPGHDAALLKPAGSGWTLHGAAVFEHEGQPACLRYALDLHQNWTTRSGRIKGFVGDREISVLVERQARGWRLNGSIVPGLAQLVHLDLGFTPATNLPQLRHASLAVGSMTDMTVAWLDTDATTLVALPQRYERRNEHAYWYEAPTVPYEALLRFSPNGFVLDYPGLWKAQLA